MERSNRDLLAALNAGDRQPLEALYHRYRGQLYSYCLRMLGDSEAAQDVVQHVFLTLAEQSRSIRDPEKLGGWLLTVASHRCHLHLAERSRVATGEGEGAAEAHQAAGDVGGRIDSHLIARALSKLPPDLREIIVLREYEDLPYKEIAEVLQVNESTVKFRLHTARKRLCDLILAAVKVEERYELR